MLFILLCIKIITKNNDDMILERKRKIYFETIKITYTHKYKIQNTKYKYTHTQIYINI